MSININNMLSESEIIKGCIRHQKKAQCILYEKYAPILLGLCMRYVGNIQEAEDLLHDGFIKILSSIGTYRHKGSFEGWLKRIMINMTINYLNKKKRILVNNNYESSLLADEIEDETSTNNSMRLIHQLDFSELEIMQTINELPDNYKIVFNLYTFENFKHREIAELLNTNENTSKSTLLRARKILQKKLLETAKNKINTTG